MFQSPAAKISAYLEENGIKQNWLAKKAGINENTLSSILKEQTKLSIERLEIICGVLGKEPNDFLEARIPESVMQ
jgi:DNA-binding Xre family transcriptional regulator